MLNFHFQNTETNILPNYGVVYNIGNLTITTQSNNNIFKIKSSNNYFQNIQISFMLA